MKTLQFNISASSLKVYADSPLLFYYSYLLEAPPDTSTNQVYGQAGNITHKMAEDYIAGKIWDLDMQFHQEWIAKKLHTLRGFNGKPLNELQYLESAKRAVKLLETKYTGKKTAEEKFEFPLLDNEVAKINLKGFIDLIHEKANGDIEICDWKTSSSAKENEFFIQAQMYCLLYYKRYKKLPIRVIYEYVKIDEVKEYTFSLLEIKQFEKEIGETVGKILSNAHDINNFELGNWDTPFNSHQIKCEKEYTRRSQKNIINLTINKNRLIFDDTLPETLKNIIRKKYSYDIEGAEWSPKFQSGQWDGKKYLFKYNSLPIGYIHNVQELIKDFNSHFKMNYEINIIDKRNQAVMKKVYNTKFKKSNKTLRDYQEDTAKKAIDKKIGLLYLSTSAGKTHIASEIIRRLNKRTLFVVNRLELVEQTIEALEEELGIKVGVMSEGQLNISSQITVGSVQTIYAILKRENEDSKKLNKFLYNIGTTIFDECQNLSDAGMYGMLSKRLINSEYLLGLSGSPFRADEKTLEMNALSGFTIVEYPTTYLEKRGWLVPTKCYFLKHKSETKGSNEYHELYNEQIVENDERNKKIINVTKKFIKEGKKVLILTKIIEHGNILHKLIPDSFLINSKSNIKKRKQDMKTFKNMDGGVLIAGIKIAGAGLNIEALDLIINASAHRSAVDTVQLIGRVKRLSKGKKFGYLVDFYDNHFYNASMDRINILKDFGNEIEIVNNVEDIKIE